MDKKTKTIAASTTAAAMIIAGGVVYYSNTSNSDIDWSQYDLNIPDITIDLGIPDISVNLGIPNIDKITDIITTTNITPSIKTIDKEIENKDIEEFNELALFVNKYNTNIDLSEWKEFVKDSYLFKDLRNINKDSTFTKSNRQIREWMKIYKEYKDAKDITYIPIKNKFKMITQVRVPKNTNELNILKQNLTYYKSEGYDSVLFAFTKFDSITNIVNTIKYIKQYCNMKVWATYTGSQSLNESVFMDPYDYKIILTNIAPIIDGYINSWRRTSAHLFAQDDVFMKFTNITLRRANPNLPIVGELYFGNSYRYNIAGKVGFEMNTFKNSSAIMIVNFGYVLINVDYLFDKVLAKYIKDIPTIAVIVGQKPYYLTLHKTNRSYKENMKIKHEVQNKFLEKGCIGVITLSDDGREVNTNNLSETLYSKLQ